MIIFKDAVSNDEMFSDAYDYKLVDNVAYEVECKMITISNGVDVDIGANDSAEGGAEALDNDTQTVNNIVHSFGLVKVERMSKKGFGEYFKAYMKTLKENLAKRGTPEEEITQFTEGIAAYLKREFSGKPFKNWDFYQGQSTESAAMIALLNFRADDITPYIVYWKHGLVEEKV